MPDLDGWSVLAALRQDGELAEVPVIMVTILDEQRRGAALGAADRSGAAAQVARSFSGAGTADPSALS